MVLTALASFSLSWRIMKSLISNPLPAGRQLVTRGFFLKGPQPCIQLSSSMFEDVLPPASLAFLVSPLECSTGLFRENLLR